ncbi:MAG TPA: hypothetical protein VGO93_15485 [Candidatus Xenobia bacterium]|jgi:hypothetical protein
MSQLTIYIPDELAKDIRRRAKAARISVSAYMAELARKASEPSDWKQQLEATYGSCSLPEVELLAPEEREGW